VKWRCSTISIPCSRTIRSASGSSSARFACLKRIRAFFDRVEVRRVHLDLRGGGEPLASPLAVDRAQSGLERCRARRPDQPVPFIGGAQDLGQRSRPPLGCLGAVLGGPEGVVRNEELSAIGPQPTRDLLRTRAFVYLPAGGQEREAEHACSRRLAHLGGSGEDAEPVRSQLLERAPVRAAGHVHARELTRRLDVERRGLAGRLWCDRATAADAHHERLLEPQPGGLVDRLSQAFGSEDVHRKALVAATRRSGLAAQPLADARRGKVREHQERAQRLPLAARAAGGHPSAVEGRHDRFLGVRAVLRRPGGDHEGGSRQWRVREQLGQAAVQDGVAVAVRAADPPLRRQPDG
jgi:hypothetical protein